MSIRNGTGINQTPPVLVMGLGNLLLKDDGVGLELLRCLQGRFASDERIEFVDGGTQGLALTHYLADRKAALFLDAVAMGGQPGDLHYLADARLHTIPRGNGAHAFNAGDLLTAAALLDQCPETVAVLGIEPAKLETGVGLSKQVQQSMFRAVKKANEVLKNILTQLETP
jgi:hydrogenase maturation protease